MGAIQTSCNNVCDACTRETCIKGHADQEPRPEELQEIAEEMERELFGLPRDAEPGRK